MELGAVQQFPEDERYLFFKNSGTVVLYGRLVTVVGGLLDMNPDFGQDAALFAGIERIIYRFFDSSEQSLAWVVEAQEMPVLGEEFAYRYVALAGGHRLCGGAARFG